MLKNLANMIEIPYFEDIRLLGGRNIPGCTVHIDKGFPDTCAFMVKTGGRLYLQVDDGGRTLWEDAAPALFWHHPDRHYRYGPLDEAGWEHHYIVVEGGRALRLIEEGFDMLAPEGYLAPRDSAPFLHILQRLIPASGSGPPVRREEVALTLEELLVLAVRERARPVPGAAAAPLHRAVGYLQKHLAEAVDLPALARSCGLSYSRFRAAFREHTGQPPHAFLRALRRERARALLCRSTLRIAEVGAAVGYEDPAEFSRFFRQQTGYSPRAYRRRLLLA